MSGLHSSHQRPTRYRGRCRSQGFISCFHHKEVVLHAETEIRNILAGYLRRGDLAESAVARCLEGAEAQLAGREYILPSSLVMQNVRKSTCSAYDREYVVLAEDLGTTLVTADEQILRDFPECATSLRRFAEGD